MNDAAILGRALAQLIGTCRICSCKGDSCRLPDGDRCAFVDSFATLCSNPACIMAAVTQRKQHRRDEREKERRSAAMPHHYWHKPKVKKRQSKKKVRVRAAQ